MNRTNRIGRTRRTTKHAIIISQMLMSLMMLTSCASTASAQSRTNTNAAPTSTLSTTPVDRQNIEVTIYNTDLGLVKEQRTVNTNAGVGELQFVGVSALINPVTVHVRPLGRTPDFAILEQNYAYDLMSHERMLDKYVGREIRIMQWNQYQDRHETVTAEVLSVANGEVFRIGDEIFLGHPGIRILPEIPGNLISRPTLSWIYNSRRGGEQQIEVSYLTHGMNWNADYILAVGSGMTSAGLSGWVTVNNTSGADFENAKLKLVAGEVNRVQRQFAGGRGAMAPRAMMVESAADASFAQSEVFEYHIYDLQRQTSLLNNQTKQIKLLEAQTVATTLEYTTSASPFMNPRHAVSDDRPGAPVRQPVNTFISFRNTEANGLGAPLPAGIMRIYTADAGGSQQFIGEDRVAHTPRDEEVRLRVGEAFDVVAERTQVSFRQRSAQQHEVEWAVTIRNRKSERVTVGVIEQAHGTWEIRESTHRHRQLNASTFRFDVPVGAGEEVTVKYTVRVGI